MVLIEEVVAVDGEEDKEEVGVIANNMGMEMKREFETTTRWDVKHFAYEYCKIKEEEKVQVLEVEEKL